MSNVLEDLIAELTNKKGGMIMPDLEEKNLPKSLLAVLGKMKTIREELESLNKQEEQEEQEEKPCLCKECLNFENFEEVFKNQKGKIDYTEFIVGGKEFKVKYWTDGVLNHISVRPVEIIKDKKLQDLINEKTRLTNLVKSYTEAGEFILAQKTITDLLVVSNKIVIIENSNNTGDKN